MSRILRTVISPLVLVGLLSVLALPVWCQEPTEPTPTEETADETPQPSEATATDEPQPPSAEVEEGDAAGEATPPPSEATGGEATPPPSEAAGGEATPPPSEAAGGEATPPPSEATPPPSEAAGGEATQPPSDTTDEDPAAGDAAAGDPVAGDAAAGDPAAGDPAAADAAAGDPAEPDDETAAEVAPAATQSSTATGTQSGPSTNAARDAASAALTPELPLPTDYRIDVRLEPDEKMLTGQMTLVYTNLSPDIIGELRFHLYLNAFKNNRSAFMREQGGNPRLGDDWWGYQLVTRALVNGVNRTDALHYAQPPDVPDGDHTVLVLPLNEPLLPGQPIEVSMDFRAKLPRVQARTGYFQDFFLIAQWFPKLGVWQTNGADGRGQWFCPPFHRNTEFFADFGDYRVTLTLPQDFVVGASGVLENSQESGSDQVLTYRAQRVHDFAWTASPRFRRAERMFLPEEWVSSDELQATMDRFNVSLPQAQLKPVKMILLYQPEHTDQVSRHFDTLAKSLKHFGLAYGPYPYETLTMVDPAFGGRDAGGMEYPNLITIGTYFQRPAGDLGLEHLIIHEFAHQYWYGMVASNEVNEAWLDEGITTYTTARMMDAVYGPSPVYNDALAPLPMQRWLGMRDPSRPSRHWHWRIPLTAWLGVADSTARERNAVSARREAGMEPIVQPGYAYRSRSAYGANAYPKSATALAMLEAELGPDVMERAMRHYFRRWQFDHPTTADFIATVNETANRDMQWFFEKVFYAADDLDVGVRVDHQYYALDAGYASGTDGLRVQAGAAPKVQARVTLTHYGSMRYPVTVAITFADGTETREDWHGEARWHRFTYPGQRVTAVQVDPENTLLLDTNRLNNSYRANPDPRASRHFSQRVLGAAQHLLQFVAGGWL